MLPSLGTFFYPINHIITLNASKVIWWDVTKAKLALSVAKNSTFSILEAMERKWHFIMGKNWLKQDVTRLSFCHYVQVHNVTCVTCSISRRKICWLRETEVVRWYSTSSLRELNFTTQRKYFPAPSRRTLKCWTSFPYLYKVRTETHEESNTGSVRARYWCGENGNEDLGIGDYRWHWSILLIISIINSLKFNTGHLNQDIQAEFQICNNLNVNLWM